MKTVLVTGGTRGIGRAIADAFFKKGYRVLDLGHIIKDYDLYRKHLENTIQDTEDRLVSFFNPD
jgi:NAD(P)-dependent dehydrogenase (short-subunit alcohol dehydrogenase family)